MSRPPERLTTMKLPLTHLQPLKLQNAGYIKHLLLRLSPGKLSPSAEVESAQAKISQPSADRSIANPLAAAKSSKGFRIAMHLLLVKPWVLVLGFWLLSLAGGSLALSGMLSPRRLTMALPEPTAVETTQSNPLITIEQRSDEISGEAEALAGETVVIGSEAVAPTTKQAENSAALTVLPVALFVGSCAAGCLVMSRRRAMARKAAARSRARARKSKLRPVTAGTKATATRTPQATTQLTSQLAPSAQGTSRVQKNQEQRRGRANHQPKRKVAIAKSTRQEAVRKGPKAAPTLKTAVSTASAQKPVQRSAQKPVQKLAQKPARPSAQPKRRRQRVRIQPAPATANGNRVLTSRATAQQPLTSQPKESRRRTQRASARVGSRRRSATGRQIASRQPVVSVVPAGEVNALDWTNGSLAHQMDIRQHRAM